MQPAKRVVVAVAVATVTSKESGVAAARLWTAVAFAVYIRFWIDLCHLINQTNTGEQHHENKLKLWGLQGVQVCSSLSYKHTSKRDGMELASRPKYTYTHTQCCVCVCESVCVWLATGGCRSWGTAEKKICKIIRKISLSQLLTVIYKYGIIFGIAAGPRMNKRWWWAQRSDTKGQSRRTQSGEMLRDRTNWISV